MHYTRIFLDQHYYLELYSMACPGSVEAEGERGLYLSDVSLPLLSRLIQHTHPLASSPDSPFHESRRALWEWSRYSMEVDLRQRRTLCGLQFLHKFRHSLYLSSLHIPRDGAGNPTQWHCGHRSTSRQSLPHLEICRC